MTNDSSYPTIITGFFGDYPYLKFSKEALDQLAEQMVDKPIKVDGIIIGRVIDACVSGKQVKFTGEICDSSPTKVKEEVKEE